MNLSKIFANWILAFSKDVPLKMYQLTQVNLFWSSLLSLHLWFVLEPFTPAP